MQIAEQRKVSGEVVYANLFLTDEEKVFEVNHFHYLFLHVPSLYPVSSLVDIVCVCVFFFREVYKLGKST